MKMRSGDLKEGQGVPEQSMMRQVRRLLRVLGLRPLLLPAYKRWREWRLGVGWGDQAGFRHRQYASHEQYQAHQRAKLAYMDQEGLKSYDTRLYTALSARLRQNGVQRGSRVLCLAARRGGEVRAFLECGCFAVGMDLNPGVDNRYVVSGDFHALQFPDQVVDIVFTNSLDHVRDLSAVVAEMRRVLVPTGRVLIEAMAGDAEGATFDYYESYSWPTVSALIERLEAEGLALIDRTAINEPWRGEHLRFALRQP
jgi:SAM-dependent methyltransferase